MKYITGIHALNLPCQLDTCGDWHSTAIQWEKPTINESEGSFFGEYGIERNIQVPFLDNKEYNVANHIRALLDLMLQNKLSIVQGIRDSYICNDDYTQEIFSKVIQLRKNDNWKEIDQLMSREYMMEWIKFKGEQSNG